MDFLFPRKLVTPHIPLGMDIAQALSILRALGEVTEENDKERSFRVTTPDFSCAVYEADGRVKAVWFNDPVGRIWKIGKQRKIRLYLARYGRLEDWEERMDNGWMKYFFNENAQVAMVYGLHMDVIRFNEWKTEQQLQQ